MPDTPGAVEVQTGFVRSILNELHTIRVGELVNFDPDTEIAEVRPSTAAVDGQGISVLVGVHLLFPGVYWRPSSGTPGIILFTEDDFSTWWRTGDVGVPPLILRHDLNGSVFIPGLRKKGDQRSYNGDDEMIVPGPAVRLGSSSATERLVKGTAYTGHESTFLTAMWTWVTAVSSVVAGLGGVGIVVPSTTFKGEIITFQNQLPGDISNVSRTD